jgi:hypothetical protein
MVTVSRIATEFRSDDESVYMAPFFRPKAFHVPRSQPFYHANHGTALTHHVTNEELAKAVDDLTKDFNNRSVRVERAERGSHYRTHRMRSAAILRGNLRMPIDGVDSRFVPVKF